MIHENIELTGSFTVSGSFVLPSHASSSAVYETGSMYHDTVDGVLKVYTGTQWVIVGEQTASAAGGAAASTDIEYLLVAGGGGASADSGGGAGGGAGGLLSASLASVTSGSSFTVTIGGGGVGYYNGGVAGPAGDGTDSSIAEASISTINSIGGGGAGSSQDTGTIYLGHDGGSGGGSGNGNANYTRPDGGSGTVGQGNDGGGAHSAGVNNGNNAAGGGGGAGAVGADAASGAGGNGGDGLQSSITGTSTYYAGGGAGGTRGSGTAGTGGQGGGGNANNTTNGTGQDGDANTGGGAGGSRSIPTAAGGSGVAIFAYDSGSFNCAGGIVGDAGNGRKYNQFNASDTFYIGGTTDFQIVTSNLVAHLDAGNFNSRGASTWTDLTGNGHNAAVNGATLNSNFYYDLDGSNDYFNITDHSDFDSQTITIETWTWFDQNKNYNQIYTKGNDGNEQFEAGGSADAGIFSAVVWGTGRAGFLGGISSVFSVNTWTHIVQVIDPSQGWLFYKDGSLIATDTSKTGTTITYQAHDLELGGDTSISGRYMDGRFAQFRFYSKGFTAAEVLQNYNATKTNFI